MDKNTKLILVIVSLFAALVFYTNVLYMKGFAVRNQQSQDEHYCHTSPVISVIVPCYNQSQYLVETVESVIAQSYTSWELVIVEDMLGGQCLPVAKRYEAQHPCRIRTYAKPNGGLADARNFGITHSRGTWICALDSDDLLAPDYFKSAMEHVANHAQSHSVNLVYADQKFFGESEWLWEVPVFEKANLFKWGPFPVMSLYTRDLFDEVGGYDPSLPWGDEDYNFWAQCAKAGIKALKLPIIGSLYRYKKESMMRTKEKFTETKYMLRLLHSEFFSADETLGHVQEIRDTVAPETLEELRKINVRFPGLWLPYFVLGLKEPDPRAAKKLLLASLEKGPQGMMQVILHYVRQLSS